MLYRIYNYDYIYIYISKDAELVLEVIEWIECKQLFIIVIIDQLLAGRDLVQACASATSPLGIGSFTHPVVTRCTQF